MPIINLTSAQSPYTLTSSDFSGQVTMPYVFIVASGGGTIEVNLPELVSIGYQGQLIALCQDGSTTINLNSFSGDIISENSGNTVTTKSVSGNKSFVSLDATNQSWLDATSGSGSGGSEIIIQGTGGATSTVRCGSLNVASESSSTVSGGDSNCACATSSTISGGGLNYITFGSDGSFIGGGVSNTSSAAGFSTISGGCINTTSSCYATIGGGRLNTSSGYLSTISGGNGNTSSAQYSTVSGGTTNTASGYSSTVSGGSCNTGSGNYTAIGGGRCNTVSGNYSGVVGGLCNIVACSCSFIVGSCITADRCCTTFVNNLSIKNIPTSAAGLPSGAIWSNAGVLTIV